MTIPFLLLHSGPGEHPVRSEGELSVSAVPGLPPG